WSTRIGKGRRLAGAAAVRFPPLERARQVLHDEVDEVAGLVQACLSGRPLVDDLQPSRHDIAHTGEDPIALHEQRKWDRRDGGTVEASAGRARFDNEAELEQG